MTIEEKLEQLEKEARKLEPNKIERDELNRKVTAYADEFLQNIEALPAYNATAIKGEGLFDHPVGDEPKGIDRLLELLREQVDIPGLNPASGGHLAYIPGGGIYPAALGDYLAAVFNKYAGIYYAGPGAVRMENMLLQWMGSLFGFPATVAGNLTTGGSLANLIGIVTARDAKKVTSAVVPDAVIYLSKQAHHSVDKAIRLAGMGESQLRYIPIDHHFRIDVEQLEKQVKEDIEAGFKPFLIIASVGTTDTGAVDPIDKIAAIAEENNCWLHIDAAYGGFFVLVDECKKLMDGIDKADSIVVDPHKGLFLPYGLGAVLIKDVEALHRSHFYQAAYLQDASSDELSPAELSPELTKHFRALRLWLPLQLFGLKPFKAALEEKIWLCRYFYEKIADIPGFETGPYPELSVMIYRYIPQLGEANEFNRRLVQEVVKDGRVFLSSTKINDIFWLRLAVLSFRTHKSTIDLCLQVLQEKVEYLKKELE